MKRFRVRFFAAVLALAVAGCVNIDYVGQEFAPTPESEPIAYFTERAELPADRYRIIGRATLTAPDDSNSWVLREKLENYAREVGADAVCQVSVRRVAVGTYPAPQQNQQGPNLEGPAGGVIAGQPVQKNPYGEEVELQQNSLVRYEIELKALFLKNREELEKLLAERREELDALLAQPPAELPEVKEIVVPEAGEEQEKPQGPGTTDASGTPPPADEASATQSAPASAAALEEKPAEPESANGTEAASAEPESANGTEAASAEPLPSAE